MTANNNVLLKNTLSTQQFKHVFEMLKANTVRRRRKITIVFLSIHDQVVPTAENRATVHQELMLFFHSIIREVDLLTHLPDKNMWCLLLTQSGLKETEAFLARLFTLIKNNDFTSINKAKLELFASFAVIGNNHATFEDLITNGQAALTKAITRGPWEIEYIDLYEERPVETIKVSILEDNPIFLHVLEQSLENLATHPFHLQVQTFRDGYEFLESEWYLSSHTHILVMNDILPRKNGLDVLHTIRNLPSHTKFIIFMMTKKNAEDDMIYAYEIGADDYLMKPFNLRLFEAKIKRALDRLWA